MNFIKILEWNIVRMYVFLKLKKVILNDCFMNLIKMIAADFLLAILFDSVQDLKNFDNFLWEKLSNVVAKVIIGMLKKHAFNPAGLIPSNKTDINTIQNIICFQT